MRHVVTIPKPLSEPVVLMLTSLASAPKHGYALLKDVEELSDGRVRLSTGTLYGAIRRLLDDRWIERFEQEDTSRDKQAYSLTPGPARLNDEIGRVRHILHSERRGWASREHKMAVSNIYRAGFCSIPRTFAASFRRK